MSQKPLKEEEFVVTLQDFLHLFTKRKKLIMVCICFFSLLAVGYKLTRPVSYTAEALFKEKQNKQGGSINQSIFEVFALSGGGNDSEAITLFKSRRVMNDVVRNLHLQASVQEKGLQLPTPRKILDNIKTQYAHFKKWNIPLFPEYDCAVSCENIFYDGEVPIGLSIQFRNDLAFSVRDSSGQQIGTGTVGEPFAGEDYEFTIHKPADENVRGKIYTITIAPINTVSYNLSKFIKIEPDKKSKHILEIKFTHTNRKLARDIVNHTMASYQKYMSDEHKRFTNKHLEYLNKRKEDSYNDLKVVMNDYAQSLVQDVNSSGYLDTDTEVRFLVENQKESLKKLQLISLDSKRLQTYLLEDRIPLVNVSETPSNSATQAIDNLRDLKQHRDNLCLALYEKKKTEDKKLSNILIDLQKELNEIQSMQVQVQDISYRLQSNQPIDENLPILHNPKLLIEHWYKEYKENRSPKKSFINYLENLAHTYDMYSHIIQERLAREFPGNIEFQGIDIETANKLFLTYNMTCNELESEERQNLFVIEQLQDPNFEIASLSTTLQDPICKEMITKASQLSFMLRDDANRSPKEQERIRKELYAQKTFLEEHLDQTAKVLKIRREMLQEKVTSLQEVILEHVNEKISVLENNLKEYVNTKIKAMQQEKDLLNTHIASLNGQMAQIPKKWVSENIVKQNIALTKTSLEEITRMVEGKNISQNLDVVQSTHIDDAIVSVLPNNPKLAFFAIVGAIFGGFLSVGYIILESILCGIEATEQNLSASGNSVSGTILEDTREDAPLDHNIETLRRALSSLDSDAKELLLITGKGPQYAKTLASLLAKQGEKVLILPLIFTNPKEEGVGLVQFFEGKIDYPPIARGTEYDFIKTGGVSRFGPEHAKSQAFEELRNGLKDVYTKVIAVAACSPCSAEAKGYVDLYDNIIVTLSNEKLMDLTSITRVRGKNITFLFSS